MKKLTLAITILAMAISLVAETVSTNAQMQAHNRRLTRDDVLRATGGRLLEPASGKGVFVIVNAQEKIAEKVIQDLAMLINEAMMIEIRVVSDKDEMSSATLEKLNAQMGVSVVDAPGKPGLIIAPEEGWAVVNIAPLAAGQDGKLNFTRRVRKEIYRAFGMVTGGCGSSYQGNLLDPIRTPDDLDMYPESDLQMPIDMLQKMPKFCDKFGVRPWRMTTYRRACHEGWAPAPTNDYQKAIWDKVHAVPTEPIKIKPEEKKTEK